MSSVRDAREDGETGVRGMPGILFEPQCSGYQALINREPGYEARCIVVIRAAASELIEDHYS